jgi:hypothetical protein
MLVAHFTPNHTIYSCCMASFYQLCCQLPKSLVFSLHPIDNSLTAYLPYTSFSLACPLISLGLPCCSSYYSLCSCHIALPQHHVSTHVSVCAYGLSLFPHVHYFNVTCFILYTTLLQSK